MSMFAGATLLASTLLGATPAQSAATSAQSAANPSPAVPAEFGTDWHDPITAAPPVSRPENTKSCEVTVAEAQFKDFTPYRGSYAPPGECGKRWSKVVLRLRNDLQRVIEDSVESSTAELESQAMERRRELQQLA